MRSSDRYGFTLLYVCLLIGCVDNAVLQQRVRSIREVIEESRKNRAYRCAPQQLAAAVAYIEFSENELLDGDPFQALSYLDVAESYARTAADRSSSVGCKVAMPERERQKQRGEKKLLGESDAAALDREIHGEISADSMDGCNGFANDMEGLQDRNRCAEQQGEGEKKAQKVERCVSESGDKVDAVCLEKYNNIEITRNAIRLKKPIVFSDNQAIIAAESYLVLDEIARFLANNPKISVEIQGHTDSAGDDAFNQLLSQKRADSVGEHLKRKGINPSRLAARGFGETTPIESNRTSRGRAANRRIEIIRTD
ncbi:MAG: OmpA family protein [Deltaproteobacteria bacterium]|nr:OmpA family protein [Deltaproteobacteria bacterium]